MKTGKVKFFNETRGYGFIVVDNSGEEVFVHATSIEGKIREGDNVQFNVIEGKKGLSAVEVKRV